MSPTENVSFTPATADRSLVSRTQASFASLNRTSDGLPVKIQPTIWADGKVGRTGTTSCGQRPRQTCNESVLDPFCLDPGVLRCHPNLAIAHGGVRGDIEILLVFSFPLGGRHVGRQPSWVEVGRKARVQISHAKLVCVRSRESIYVAVTSRSNHKREPKRHGWQQQPGSPPGSRVYVIPAVLDVFGCPRFLRSHLRACTCVDHNARLASNSTNSHTGDILQEGTGDLQLSRWATE